MRPRTDPLASVLNLSLDVMVFVQRPAERMQSTTAQVISRACASWPGEGNGGTSGVRLVSPVLAHRKRTT